MHRRSFIALGLAFVASACSTPDENQSNVDGTGGLGDGYGDGSGSGLEVEGLDGSLDSSSAIPQPTIAWLAEHYGDTVLFDYDSSSLNPAADATVRQWAEWMRQFPAISVVIQGHCDERGTREYNLALGDRRASAVRNVLLALGIAPNRVGTISFGKERPAVSGHDEAAWARNRRAVLTIA
ncbi:MAG: peptidoglycan-associated lipoprotein Pal [Proteobacteria bacterium]|nr:peptidoglycan-associated lipoprotein Pal [Pseudomonadota bacterium]MDA0952739.1 peptidoglycan-associated lipoprotein Pal [Pseudomonadota bacterium]MDA1073022.1 peptidoglycan-associated lipoprotein Pal [Pseudomonadota bacterium]